MTHSTFSYVSGRNISFFKFLGIRFFSVLLLLLLVSGESWGQVNISGGNTITQNFNTIGTTATATLPTGWKVDNQSATRTFGTYAAAGTATTQSIGPNMSATATSGIYNYGSGSNNTGTDRAVGGLSASSSNRTMNLYVDLLNNGAGSIGSYSITYNVEKYRTGTLGMTIQLYYSTDGSTWSTAGANFTTNLAGDASTAVGPATVPISSTSVTSQTLSVTTTANSHLYLMWSYSATSGTSGSNAQALGIDDISITATAVPSTYSATYNSNSATSGTVPTDATAYSPAASVTVKTNSGSLARTGYVFAGWNTAADGTGTTYAADGTASFTINANTTLYAKWTPTYTVTYNANNATSGTAPTDGNSPYTSGATVTALTNSGSLARTGYAFAGWNTAANGGGTDYAASGSATFTINTNATLYAKWTANNNIITFDGNGSNGGSMSTQSIATAASANLTTNAYTKTGYAFAGWANSAGGAVVYANGASYTMGTSDVTLYAKWTANNNTITFNGNGSDGGSMSAQTIATDASASLTSNGFTRTGYSFSAWNTASDGSGTAYSNGASYAMGVSNVTLYAQWTVISTPTINVTGGLSAVSTTYGTASSATSFSVSGSALNADILVTPPSGFEVSQTSGGASGYAATQTVSQSGGTVSSTNIYLRLAATTTAASYSGNVVLSSSGATSQNVATVSSTVSPYSLSVSGLSGVNKPYDGGLTASLTGSAVLSSTVNSDVISLDGSPTGAFVSSTVADGKTINITGLSISGAKSTSYSLTPPTTTANITTVGLTITGISAVSRAYNTTNVAALSGTAAYVGLVNSESFTVSGTPSATFADASAATAKAVTITGYTAPSANYTVTQPTGLTADITKANQTITLAATGSKNVGDADYSPATASSGLAVSYSSSNTAVATIISGNIHIVGAGTTTITPSQAGNANYNSAPDVTPQTLTVTYPITTIVTFPSSWTGTPASAVATSQNTNINNTVTVTRGSGLTAGSSTARFNSTGWPTTSSLTLTSNNSYLTFTVTAKQGYSINLNGTALNFALGSSGTGPSKYGVYSSVGGFTSTSAQIGADLTTSSTSITFPSSGYNNLSSIEIRIYGWNATAGTGTGGFSSMNLTGSLGIQTFSIACSSSDLSKGIVSSTGGTYNTGSAISLTATPTSGSYRFVNWTEGGTFVSRASTYTFSASANRTLVANFESFAPAISSTINASTITDCATCDLTVASGGALTIDEAKTFNTVTVAPGAKLTVADGSTLTAPITLQSSASGTGTFVDANTATNPTAVTGTVQQYLAGSLNLSVPNRNWYVSIPVNTANVSDLSTATSVVCWNEPTGTWVAPSISTLNPLRGYISAGSTANSTISFSGTLNSGPQSITLSRTQNAYKEGFNLIGNPYPSYVSWTAATKTNLDPSMWLRTQNLSGAYVFDTYNGVGTNNNGSGAVTGIIPPMQAFWVRVLASGDGSSTTGSVAFDNTMRSHESGTNKLKAPATKQEVQQVLRLQVSNGINSDETIVLINPNASNSFDAYDSQKMTNGNVAIPEIYSLADSKELVINGMNSIQPNMEIPLGFTTGQSNTFTIKATEISNFDVGTAVILKDKLLNTEQELSATSAYNFSSDPTTTDSRFSIIFKSAGMTAYIDNKTGNQGISVYKNSINQITIRYAENINSQSITMVYNTLGQKLITKQITSDITVINNTLAPGVYLVIVNNNGKSVVKEVVIN